MPELLPPDRVWVRAQHGAQSAQAATEGTYVNAFDDDGTEGRVRSAYGVEEYDRLPRIKREYHPGNVFHRNADIRPAAQAPAQRTPAPDRAPGEVGLDAGP